MLVAAVCQAQINDGSPRPEHNPKGASVEQSLFYGMNASQFRMISSSSKAIQPTLSSALRAEDRNLQPSFTALTVAEQMR